MRRHERRPGDQRRVPRQQPGHRVNRGDFQRLALRQRRQQPRKALREHRFAHPRRAGEHQVVGPGRGQLHREPGLRLPDHVDQIRRRLRGGGVRLDPAVQGAGAAQPVLQLAQRAHAPHVDAVDQAGLGQVVGRDHHGRPAVALGGQHRGQHPAHRPDPPVQRQLAQQHRLVQPVPRVLPLRRQHRRRQSDVVDAAHFRQRRRRQRQRQPRLRPVVGAVADRRPDPVARLLQRGVRQPHQMHAGQTGRDVGLDLHDLSVHAAHRDGERASQRHQPIPCRCVISGVRRRPTRTPITSMRMAAQRRSWPTSHSPASRRSRRTLRGVTACGSPP